jgi:hypothetical protein
MPLFGQHPKCAHGKTPESDEDGTGRCRGDRAELRRPKEAATNRRTPKMSHSSRRGPAKGRRGRPCASRRRPRPKTSGGPGGGPSSNRGGGASVSTPGRKSSSRRGGGAPRGLRCEAQPSRCRMPFSGGMLGVTGAMTPLLETAGADALAAAAEAPAGCGEAGRPGQ